MGNWVKPNSMYDSDLAFQKAKDMLVPIASTPTNEKRRDSRPLNLSMSFQKQDDDMLDCQSEFERWSSGLDRADLFGVGLENVQTPRRVQRLTEKTLRSCDLTPRVLNFSEAASDSGIFTSCGPNQTKDKQRKPGTKLDQLRAMVKETSRQVGTAINQVTVATQSSPPAKDLGATNCKVDWFSQRKFKEPIKPHFNMCDSGCTAQLVGHSDPGNFQHVHEHSTPLCPFSPKSSMFSSRKSKDLSDSREPSSTVLPGTPKSTESVESKGFATQAVPHAATVLAKPLEPPNRSWTSAVTTMVKTQHLLSLTSLQPLTLQIDCAIDGRERNWQPRKPAGIV